MLPASSTLPLSALRMRRSDLIGGGRLGVIAMIGALSGAVGFFQANLPRSFSTSGMRGPPSSKT